MLLELHGEKGSDSHDVLRMISDIILRFRAQYFWEESSRTWQNQGIDIDLQLYTIAQSCWDLAVVDQMKCLSEMLRY